MAFRYFHHFTSTLIQDLTGFWLNSGKIIWKQIPWEIVFSYKTYFWVGQWSKLSYIEPNFKKFPRLYCNLQNAQYGVVPHIKLLSKQTIYSKNQFFDNIILLYNPMNWLPKSDDLMLQEFFSGGNVKSRAFTLKLKYNTQYPLKKQ